MPNLPIERLRFHFRRASRSIWVRPSLYALAAIATVAAGPLFSQMVPEAFLRLVSQRTVDDLLAVLSTSLLAVAIFSLGTLVQALQAAASSATPRARPLLAEDQTGQNAIATFIGAFLFSVLGQVGLGLGLFDPGGRLVLFALTVLLVLVVVATLIGWLKALAGMGSVAETIERVEAATGAAFRTSAEAPFFGGAAADHPPADGTPVRVEHFAYIQHVDGAALGEVGDRLGVDIHLVARPGAWIDPTMPLVIVDGVLDERGEDALRRAFTLGRQRTFEVDPRFGLRVLGEIAARALSPALNDKGTAIEVVCAATRLLADWEQRSRAAEPSVVHARLRVPPVEFGPIFEDAFRVIARDGADEPEVACALQQSLAALARVGDGAFAHAARAEARRAFELAAAKLDEHDRRRLEVAAGGRVAPD